MDNPRILGIYAHPDDADVGAGATLAHFVAAGSDVALVVVTSGDAGGFDPGVQSRMAEIRRQEQIDAALCLGIEEVTFLDGYADGNVEVTKGLVRDLVAQIRRYRPELILTMSPEYNWSSVAANHPDHRAVGAATVEAVYPAARNPFAFPELLAQGLEPWTVNEVWFQGHQNPNHYLPVNRDDLDRKLKAVKCHASQFEDVSRVERFVEDGARQAGAGSGVDGVEMAEAFLKFVTG